MYMRMSLIMTMAVWWSFQAWFSVWRKLLFRELRTSSRTFPRTQTDSVTMCGCIAHARTHTTLLAATVFIIRNIDIEMVVKYIDGLIFTTPS